MIAESKSEKHSVALSKSGRERGGGERREWRLTFERVAKGYHYITLCPIDDG